MRAPEIVAVSTPGPQLATDVTIVTATKKDGSFELGRAAAEIDAALDNELSKHLERVGYKASRGEYQVVATMGRIPAGSVAVLGLGSDEDASTATRRAAGALSRAIKDRNEIGIADIEAPGAVIEGVLLGSYRFERYKADARTPKMARILATGSTQDVLDEALAVAEAVALARDLTNEPGNYLYPEAFADRVHELAETYGLEFEAYDEKALADRGFGGLLGVAAGSDRPPRFIRLRHRGSQGGPRLALVGKGVTFDSGGLSLKNITQIEQMKTDKGGAGAVIATMTAIARLQVPIDVEAFVPATENLPGPSALKPGDVITFYGGKTCEVLNTDAEGRLILADALAFASEQKPDAIVDAATLTGSMSVALGGSITGYFANDESLAQEIEAASREAGEPLWRMPLFEEYRKDLDSHVADMKNIATRFGGALYAALFLKEFVDASIPWAHLDIAGPARIDGSKDDLAPGATGVPTRTLIKWIQERARS